MKTNDLHDYNIAALSAAIIDKTWLQADKAIAQVRHLVETRGRLVEAALGSEHYLPGDGTYAITDAVVSTANAQIVQAAAGLAGLLEKMVQMIDRSVEPDRAARLDALVDDAERLIVNLSKDAASITGHIKAHRESKEFFDRRAQDRLIRLIRSITDNDAETGDLSDALWQVKG